MGIGFWIGLVLLAALAAFVVFALRQGSKVKPDPERKPEDWTNILPGGGAS
jgi:hypothetical protein